MDETRFDDIAKVVGTVRSRRETLRALFGGSLGAAIGLTALGLDEAEAKRKKARGKGKKKAKKKGNRKRGARRTAVAQTENCPTGELIIGNPSLCAGGVRVNDPGASGQLEIPGTGGCTCKVKWEVTDGKYLTITSSNCTDFTVVVKGGPNAFQYTGINVGDCMRSPDNEGGNVPNISHFDVCAGTCCIPKTCEELGKECGEWPDTCGGTVDCGECEECPNSFCDAKGKCDCAPETCESLGKTCGIWDDGCCGTVDCGPCVCTDDESPKGCPHPGDDPQWTCKRCEGVTQGSLQVECDGATPKCVCNSNNCTVNGNRYPRGTNLTGICPPVDCASQ